MLAKILHSKLAPLDSLGFLKHPPGSNDCAVIYIGCDDANPLPFTLDVDARIWG